jgi:gamma-glutamyltranspeptidase / glutathione hydrolase
MRHSLLVAGFTAIPALAFAQQTQDTGTVRRPGPPEVASTKGMVICASDVACDAGASVLRRGGNAIDAAVATAFAMAVTYPAAGNIGGGGLMVVRNKKKLTTFDFRERAPFGATPTMYLDTANNINRRLTAQGHLAPGVPGTVRGLEMAHKKHGKLPWRDVVMPAVALARDGFTLSTSLANSLNRELTSARGMQPFPQSVAAYGKPGGGEWVAGDRIVLADLGRSLQSIADGGANAFYKGWIADSIAAEMARNSGLITKRDLAEYRARERKPVHGTFRGYDVYSMPPPSSGGVALLTMLNIAERVDLRVADRWSPRTLHMTIESMRLAFLDRARSLGDPDFVKVPVKDLTSTKHASILTGLLDSTRATPSVRLAPDLFQTVAAEPEETTHISTVDGDGNAVSLTYTLEGGYGSHVVARGTGIILNNEMGDFNKKPGFTNLTGDIGTPPNIIAPGKRMLSSMTPTIVMKNGDLALVTGSPGGRTIINTVFNVVLNSLEFGMDARAAVDAPRYHHQWLPDTVTFESRSIPAETEERLRSMGHAVRQRSTQGDAHTIRWDSAKRTAFGANDMRSRDSKVSVP